MSPNIIESVAKITQPLALAGLIALILFGVFRLILKLDVFPQLRAGHGYALLVRIVDRVFVLALVALVIGLIGYFLVQPSKTGEAAYPLDLADKTSKAFYEADAATLYDLLPAFVQKNFPTVSAVEATVKRELFQLPGAPRYRTLKSHEVSGSNGIAIYQVEFDSVSSWLEQVGVVRVDGVWKLYNINVMPAEWPTESVSAQMLPYSTAEAFAAAIRAVSTGASGDNPATFTDKWIPPPGWNVTVSGTEPTKGARTCDVSAVGGGTTFRLVVVLGGCKLTAGQQLVVFGKISSANADRVDVRSVRVFPRQL